MSRAHPAVAVLDDVSEADEPSRPLAGDPRGPQRRADDGIAAVPLDALVQGFLDALREEGHAMWRAGDYIAKAWKDMAAVATSKAEAETARKLVSRRFAAEGKLTTAYVVTLGQVAGTFGTEHREKPAVSWKLAKASYYAGLRTKRPAVDVLSEAVEQGHGTRQVNQLGRTAKGKNTHLRVSLNMTCAKCGCGLRVRNVTGKVRGLGVKCPVCVAVAERDHGDAFEVDTLGRLQ